MSDDEDEDNEEQNEDDNEEEEVKMRSYSKKKHFGQANRQVKLLKAKTTYRVLKQLKFTAQSGIKSPADSLLQGMKWKLQQKGDSWGINCNNKASCVFDRHWKIASGELTSKLSKSIDKTTLTFTGKITTKNQLSAHLAHSLKYWDRFRVNYSVEGERKRGHNSGTAALKLIARRSLNSIPWAPFLSAYSEELGGKVSLKSSLQLKQDLYYKGHFVTAEKHGIYLQNKLNYGNTLANTLTLNCQDNLGILTFNGSLCIEDWTVKSKEMRILMEFQKMFRFGVQKRNDDYELMFERYKIKSDFLRAVQFHASNGGLMTTFEGKIKPLARCDYKLQLKLKHQPNFLPTARIGFALKFNL